MKNYKFVCLLFLCLIPTSCENTTLEEEVYTTQVTTRSSIDYDELSRNSTGFKNIISYDEGSGIGYMQGDVVSLYEGVEYDFILYSEMTGGLKCVVWGLNGTIIYNGKYYGSIYGVNKQEIHFTFKLNSLTTNLRLAIEGGIPSQYREATARLIIKEVRYQGRIFTPSSGFFDLNVHTRAWEDQASPSIGFHWKCNDCGSLNAQYNTTCLGCGKNH